jgi:cytochrome c oxidase cbb3-type subunit III
MLNRIVQPVFIAFPVMLSACSHSEGGSTAGPPATGLPSAGEITAVPMGHIAGITDSAALARSIPNPYEGNPQAVASGKALYIKMNCAGCHAYNAKGNMGPDLTDTYWRYGGLPAEIYRSIHDGRAQGMPAWGSQLPPQEIWKLVAYIQSLGGTYSVDGTPRNAQRAALVAPELGRQGDDREVSAPSAEAQPDEASSAAEPAPAPSSYPGEAPPPEAPSSPAPISSPGATPSTATKPAGTAAVPSGRLPPAAAPAPPPSATSSP